MKSLAIQAVVVLAAAISAGTYAAPWQQPIPQSPAPQQSILFKVAGPLTQTSPRYPGLGIPIHISVTGTPLAGTWIGYEEPDGGKVILFNGQQDVDHRKFRAELRTANQAFPQAVVCATRDIVGNAPIWSAYAMYYDGVYGGGSNGTFALNGPDFGCTGTAGWNANPAYAGGGTITVSISP